MSAGGVPRLYSNCREGLPHVPHFINILGFWAIGKETLLKQNQGVDLCAEPTISALGDT